MITERWSPELRAAALFLLIGLLWFLTAELAGARLLGPGRRDVLEAAARWGAPVLGALLVYALTRRARRQVDEVTDRLGGTRELLRRAARSMHDALFVIDVEERAVVSCNPAAVEMFGYDRDAMIGASTRLLHVNDEHWRSFAESSDPVVAQGGTWRGEFEMRRADGRTFRTEHAVTLLDETDGDRVLAVSVVRDVSERAELEEELRRMEQRHRAILANVSDMVTVVDDDGEILYVNSAIRDLFGWEPDEVTGRIGFELVHPGDRERVEEAFRGTLRSGTGRARYRLRRDDGGWARVESRGVVADADELTGTVVVTRALEADPGDGGGTG